MQKIILSIIIVSYNTAQLTYNCVKSIIDSETEFLYEVILVDNNSSDKTIEYLKNDFPAITIISSLQNLGFSKGNNIGINESKGEYVLLLNSDTLLLKNSLQDLVKAVIKEDYDITGPILLNEDQTIQRSWFNFPSATKIFFRLTNLYTLFYKLSKSWLFRLILLERKPAFMIKSLDKDTQMDYLTFACILIKRKVLDDLGQLDEELFFYQEDCEYGLRAKKKGYKFIYCTAAKIIHLGGSSSGKFSWMAFENDILGLLHVYKKHYAIQKFTQIKHIIVLALSIRIYGSYFGLFTQLQKSGLYKKDHMNLKVSGDFRNKYKELRNRVKNYM